MANVKVEYAVLGAVSTNAYFIYDEDTKDAVIIDPADSINSIKAKIERLSLNVRAVLLTHGHFDHIMAAKDVSREYGVKIYGYINEADICSDPEMNLSFSFMGESFSLKLDETLNDGELVEFGSLRFRVLHTPGHTKGSCCYYMEDEKILICGDTIFNQSVGRTDFPTGSAGQLLKSIKEKIFTLPDDVVCYPGHGDSTTVGIEKVQNVAAAYLK